MKFQDTSIHRLKVRTHGHTDKPKAICQDFQDFFSKGDNSERRHNSEKKKNTGHLFFHEESIYEISRH